MLRSIGNKSGDSVASALKKKRKVTMGRICITRRFQAWNDRVGVMNDESGESMSPMEEVPFIRLGGSKMERLVRG